MIVDGDRTTEEYHNEALRKLGARVRHLRRKRGMTQRDLSFPGCTYSYLARIEAGDRRPSPRVLMEIARRLDVTTEELAGEVPTEQRGRSLELLDASMMVRQGRIAEAEELLRGVLREAEVSGDAQRIGEANEGLAAVAARRGDHRGAMRLLEHARDAGPAPDPGERVELYERLFESYRRAGDLARAIALAEDCLDRLRRSPMVDGAKVVRYAVLLSRAYTQAGEQARAAAVLDQALEDGGGLVDIASRAAAEYELSQRHAAAGAIDTAVRHADRSLLLFELDDDGAALGQAHLVFAQRLLDSGDVRAGVHLRAARGLLRADADASAPGRLLVEEARHALLEGDTAEAARCAHEAVVALGSASGPSLGEAHLVLARVQDELGEIERADAAYAAAVDAMRASDVDPAELARAYRWYGKFLKRVGRAEAALEAFELAADLAPSNWDASAPSAAAARDLTR
jgi:tetratricopeptide (TPR) repeat protein/DNA-binding XRE family transcriptional regulator